MSATTDHFDLPIPDDAPEAGQSGYEALLAARNALIALDGLLHGFAGTIAGKAPAGHGHAMAAIEGLAEALEGKMPAGAAFAFGDLSDVDVGDAPDGYVVVRFAGGFIAVSPQAAIGAHQHLPGDIQGLAPLLAAKADAAVTLSAGAGLSGGGNLTANRAFSVLYGATAGTAAQGNDARLSDSREWTAATVGQAEAEAGTATTRRAWTAQRVRQAIEALAPAPAPAVLARAWVSFDGTGSGAPTITAGHNVSSVTRNGTGDYTVNFATPMATANYVAIVTTASASGTNGGRCGTVRTKTANSCRVLTASTGGGSLENNPDINVLVMG